jgi:hypothetical protein
LLDEDPPVSGQVTAVKNDDASLSITFRVTQLTADEVRWLCELRTALDLEAAHLARRSGRSRRPGPPGPRRQPRRRRARSQQTVSADDLAAERDRVRLETGLLELEVDRYAAGRALENVPQCGDRRALHVQRTGVR